MRRIFSITFLLLTSLSFAQNVNVYDYKVPVSTATTFRINGFWNWTQVGEQVTSNNASANLVFRKFYSSLPTAWFISADATGGKNYGKYNHDVLIDASFRKYIWEDRNWFGFTRLKAQHINYFKHIANDLTVGAGYGRYINATALAKAVRIEEHLLKENILSDNLPKETLINIANIIERQDEYQNIYGEAYETQWFDDIEKEIQSTRYLRGYYLGSIGILRMRQVLFGINERVNERYYGWDISSGILFNLSSRDTSKPGSPNLSLSGRYSYPISWRTQINSVVEMLSPVDTLFGKRIRGNVGVDFIFELSNRVNFVAGYRLGLMKPEYKAAYLDNQLSISFLFYIENNIYLGLNGIYEKFSKSPKRLSTSLTLSYNLY